jgi:hypothetical protein
VGGSDRFYRPGGLVRGVDGDSADEDEGGAATIKTVQDAATLMLWFDDAGNHSNWTIAHSPCPSRDWNVSTNSRRQTASTLNTKPSSWRQRGEDS